MMYVALWKDEAKKMLIYSTDQEAQAYLLCVSFESLSAEL